MIKKSGFIIESIPVEVEEIDITETVYEYFNETQGRGLSINGIHSFKESLLANEGIVISDNDILRMRLFDKQLFYNVTYTNGRIDKVRVSLVERKSKRYVLNHNKKPKKSVTDGLSIEVLMG